MTQLGTFLVTNHWSVFCDVFKSCQTGQRELDLGGNVVIIRRLLFTLADDFTLRVVYVYVGL